MTHPFSARELAEKLVDHCRGQAEETDFDTAHREIAISVINEAYLAGRKEQANADADLCHRHIGQCGISAACTAKIALEIGSSVESLEDEKK